MALKPVSVMKTVPSHGPIPIKSALDRRVILNQTWMVSALGEQCFMLSQEHKGLRASIWTVRVALPNSMEKPRET